MNKVILMGRLTRDPELSQTPSGVTVARFTLAVDRRYSSKDGQRQTDFINCTAWRQTAEFLARYFRKGQMAAVEGSIQTRSWDDKDGKRQYATDVVVEQVYFTGSKAESGGNSQGGYNNGYSQNNGYNNGGYNNAGFNQAPQGGFGQNNSYRQSAPTFAQQPPSADVDDFEALGFASMDGSEDDMPF